MRGALGIYDSKSETLAVKRILDRACRQKRDLTVIEREVIYRIKNALKSNNSARTAISQKSNYH